jgi:ParB-like chromosome segregation protein Spo0J
VAPHAREGYQSGLPPSHRALAARKAGLTEVPCWVRELSDDDAYIALVLNNTQGELHALEIGRHALESGKDVRAYAAVTQIK